MVRWGSSLSLGVSLLSCCLHGAAGQAQGDGLDKARLLKHAMQQMRLLVVEKDGFDAWTAAKAEQRAQERFLRTGSRQLQNIGDTVYTNPDGTWTLEPGDVDWVGGRPMPVCVRVSLFV